MATKVTILGQQEPKQEKKIEFVKMLLGNIIVKTTKKNPCDYDNIILICSNYGGIGMDLFFAYDDDVNIGALYLGHFNDGIV